MKSSNKKTLKKETELILEISIGDSDSELFKKLKRIVTTQKLPTKK
jgi:hypothetical protein